jgi:hypothetical protein
MFILGLLQISKKHPRLAYFLGKLANCFAKGALDRIVRNMLKHLEATKRKRQSQLGTSRHHSSNERKYLPASPEPSSSSSSASSKFTFERKSDANYLLLIPFQIDLLLTVLVYKILTRDVYFETCQTYLTTYHNRQSQVVCWLKNVNKNVSNLSVNTSLHQYCRNQSITYINYEHNDVVCSQYVFKSINIIDTITNMFAWHQAIVFVVTRSILFSHWYQRQVRKTSCWTHLYSCQRRLILFLTIFPLLTTYVLGFVFIMPIHFFFVERRRIDLTRHLLYACMKFIIATIVHTNLYTVCEWYSIFKEKEQMLSLDEEQTFGEKPTGPLDTSFDKSERDTSSILTVKEDRFVPLKSVCSSSTDRKSSNS